MFAEDVVKCFLEGRQILSLYREGFQLHSDAIDQKRQEIGKLACMLFNEKHKGDRNSVQEVKRHS